MRISKHFLGLLACAAFAQLVSSAAQALPRVDLVVQPPRASIDVDGSLTVTLGVSNDGTGLAKGITVDRVRLHGGHRVEPVTLPVRLADLSGDQVDLLNLRFHIAGAPPNHYRLALEGHFIESDDTGPDGHRRHRHREGVHAMHRHADDDGRHHGRSREDEEWEAEVDIDLTGTGTVSDTGGSVSVTTHETHGPYPPLPQAPAGERDSDSGLPAPPGVPRQVFPPTARGHQARDPQISSYPGVTPDGGVGFVVNTGNATGVPFPMDPNAAAPGGAQLLAMATGNTFIKWSTDGGNTFPNLISNFSTVFGDNPDAGWCCDQVLHYIPSIDRVLWVIQTRQSQDAAGNATSGSRERLAWARPADLVANFSTAWTWIDLTPGLIGLGGNDFIDYPDIAVSAGFAWVSFNDTDNTTQPPSARQGGGLIVTRISLADLQKPGGSQVTIDFTHRPFGKTAFGSHLLQNASGTMYWGGQSDTNHLQVCHWADSSGSYGCETHAHSTHANTGPTYASQAPDNQFWLAPQFTFDRVLSAVRKPGELWFGWNSGRHDSFPHPYVHILKLREDNLEPFDEFEIWNPDHAYAYPAFNVNTQTNEVAVSLMWGGGGKYFENHAVGFMGDFVVWITTGSNVTPTSAGPPSGFCQDASFANPTGRCTRSGDYLGVRRVGSSSGLFVTAGYETLLGDTTKAADCLAAGQTCSMNLRYVEFGRPADTGGGPGIPPPR